MSAAELVVGDGLAIAHGRPPQNRPTPYGRCGRAHPDCGVPGVDFGRWPAPVGLEAADDSDRLH